MIQRNRKLLAVAAAGALSAGLVLTTVPAANAGSPGAASPVTASSASSSSGAVYSYRVKSWDYTFKSKLIGGTGSEYKVEWEAVPGATKYVVVGNEGIYGGGTLGTRWVTLGQFDASTTQATVNYVASRYVQRPAQSLFVIALTPDGQQESLVAGYGYRY